MRSFWPHILSTTSAAFPAAISPQSGNTHLLDLSAENTEDDFLAIRDQQKLGAYIEKVLAEHGKTFAYGGYGEIRSIYSRFPHFNVASGLPRDHHLGVDLWCPAGTPIRATLSGNVHSCAYNNLPGDYGGTVILEHHLPKVHFYTLYGHLSQEAGEKWKKGAPVQKGEIIGSLGEADENGGWPPHLHFQVVKDMLGFEGDFPGVVSAEDFIKYQELCPDPEFLLQTGLYAPKGPYR